jgi:hypothetical protein
VKRNCATLFDAATRDEKRDNAATKNGLQGGDGSGSDHDSAPSATNRECVIGPVRAH